MLAPETPAFAYLGTGLMAFGTVWDTIQALKPAEEWWEQSFEAAVPAATEPLLSYLEKPSESSRDTNIEDEADTEAESSSTAGSASSGSSSFSPQPASEPEVQKERQGGAIEISYGWNTFLESASWDNYADEGGIYMNNFILRYLYQCNDLFSLGGGFGLTVDNREGDAWDEEKGWEYYEGGSYIMPTLSFVVGNKVDSFALGADLLLMTVDHWEGIHGTIGLYVKNFFVKFSPIYFTTQDNYEYAHESYWELGYSFYFGD